MENKNKALTAEKNRCAKKLKKLSKELEELKSSLSIFNDDQWKALSSKSMRGYYWSDETVTKALQLRFACGSSGYDMLISQGFPLPNNRTLQRRMQNIDFQPGILTGIMKLLKLKVEKFSEDETFCNLVLDEMSIKSALEYDVGDQVIRGNYTINPTDQLSSHGLVFMLAGIKSRWKQIICYHFTGASFEGKDVKNILIEIIHAANSIGLKVINITSDMGPCNQSV